MVSSTQIIFIFIGIINFLGLVYFTIISHQENEKYTVKVASLSSLAIAIFWIIAILFSPEMLIHIFIAIFVLINLILFLSFLPIFNKSNETIQRSNRRKDERDIPFSRIRLQKGTQAYQQYYALRPENEEIDKATRKRPGLMSAKSLYYDPIVNAATEASFFLTEFAKESVDGDNRYAEVTLPPQEASQLIKNYAKHFGALDTGITNLRPEHVYTNIGRGAGTYGEEIKLNEEHNYAIAFTVEMDFELIKTAPLAPGCMESAHQYVEAARTAIQLAAFIRNLGYEARAHIDGNYRVVAPLIARDAGLGEIGRMSLLMTPKQGPRVRLGVVTTNMPLTPDNYTPNHAVLEFCQICKKCARTCPSQSISYEDRKMTDGALQWKIDPISCFNYWCTAGTDCGVCMAVCPFSHPNTPAHNAIRFGIQHSRLFRHAANFMDDIFYGKKPKPHPIPKWIKSKTDS